MNDKTLRRLIIESLKQQGFQLKHNRILLPTNLDKGKLRSLHAIAVRHRIERARKHLSAVEPKLLGYLATGREVIPNQIKPRLVEVRGNSDEELLFRYSALHWSIPTSSGYGRRIRFLVVDESNGKLIGLFGLGDPVINLGARDDWVGWDRESRHKRLKYVMDAFVLGAVPPYSMLLGGKLVAMLTTSNEVRRAFKRKYRNKRSIINQRKGDGKLALLTTTSALGRSSIYNRLKFKERPIFTSVGFTKGSGEFHFSNGLYKEIFSYAKEHCEPTAKQDLWGDGFRNRREVLKKCLPELGLPTEWLYHGVKREVFVIPLARNTIRFLKGEHSKTLSYDQSVEDLFGFFKERWLLPRCVRDRRYKLWGPKTWQLWR